MHLAAAADKRRKTNMAQGAPPAFAPALLPCQGSAAGGAARTRAPLGRWTKAKPVNSTPICRPLASLSTWPFYLRDNESAHLPLFPPRRISWPMICWACVAFNRRALCLLAANCTRLGARLRRHLPFSWPHSRQICICRLGRQGHCPALQCSAGRK